MGFASSQKSKNKRVSGSHRDSIRGTGTLGPHLRIVSSRAVSKVGHRILQAASKFLTPGIFAAADGQQMLLS